MRLRYAQIHGLLYGQMFTAQRRPTTSLLVPASQPGHHSRAWDDDFLASLLSSWSLHAIPCYFTGPITRLVNGWPENRIDELMPWFWLPPAQPPWFHEAAKRRRTSLTSPL